jgi:hypothetical protein
MPTPPKRRTATRGPRQPRQQTGIATRWTGFRPLFDYWGNEIARFYKLETLAGAVDWSLNTKRDRFLIPSIQQALGPAPVISLAFELFQEGRYQIIFRVRAINAKRKQGVFALVVAKRADDYSKVAAGEHANLRVINERAPQFVVRPFRGGNIYLPDRHGRAEHGRDIYVYLTQWLAGFHELGINDNLQCIVNVKARHTFTIAQTEQLKAQMIEIVASTYNPKKRDCMDLPEIASGDFVVTAPPRSPRLKLIACRRMLRNVTPVKLLDKIAAASWPWGNTRFHLAPEDPRMFYEAIERAIGKDPARDAFVKYAAAVRAGKLPQRNTLPKQALDDLTAS